MIDNTLFLADKTPVDGKFGFFSTPSVNFGKSLPELSAGEDIYITFAITKQIVINKSSLVSVALYGSEGEGLNDLITGMVFSRKNYREKEIGMLIRKINFISELMKDTDSFDKDKADLELNNIRANMNMLTSLPEYKGEVIAPSLAMTTIPEGTSFTLKLSNLHSLPYRDFSVVISSSKEAKISGEITAYLSLTPPFTNHIYPAVNVVFCDAGERDFKEKLEEYKEIFDAEFKKSTKKSKKELEDIKRDIDEDAIETEDFKNLKQRLLRKFKSEKDKPEIKEDKLTSDL